jgi:hypothetical protein
MRVSTVTLWTLTALAAGDLTQKAIATPVSPDPLPHSEDLAASSDALSTDVVITSVAPAESLVVEPFTSNKVPEPVVNAATQPDSKDPSERAIAPISAEPSVAEPSAAEATLMPVAGLMTVNTTPESTSIPERRIESRMPPEAVAPAAPDLVAEQIAQVSPDAPSPAAPTPTEADPTDSEIDELQRQLNAVPTLQPDFGDEFGGSPAITISNPSGRGADRFTTFLNTSFQADKRGENGADGSLGVGIGLGDARRAVGLQLSYTLASFGTQGRDFGTGGFNAKLHHQFPNGLSAALGWEGFATIGNVDFKDTVYGSVTQIIRTTPNIDTPLSRIALTAGVGNGRFRSEDDFNNGVDSVSVFGSAAVRIARPLSVIVEWTGQDLAAGLSIAPIRNFPLVITPALRDIAGAGDGARFVIGTGVSFKF